MVNYYHQTLKQSSEALRYLKSRGLTDPEMIDRFKLGFANRTLGYRLPEKNRKSGAELRGRLQRLGILRESGHEHFKEGRSRKGDSGTMVLSPRLRSPRARKVRARGYAEQTCGGNSVNNTTSRHLIADQPVYQHVALDGQSLLPSAPGFSPEIRPLPAQDGGKADDRVPIGV